MPKYLFVCSQNQLRSPTAETVFSNRPGYEVDSAGTDPTAAVPLSSEQVEWADIIFAMEKVHRNRIQRKFKPFLKTKRIIVLNIPDQFEYMEPALVKLLEARLGPYFLQK